MRVFSAVLGVAGVCLLTLSSAAASVRPHHRSATHAVLRHSFATHATHHVEQHSYDHVSISPERATEIQTALIKQGYLAGDPTGTWDSSSIAAMQKLQSDNGWQTKLVPDSRALIKLGLGPGAEAATAATEVSPGVVAADTLATN